MSETNETEIFAKPSDKSLDVRAAVRFGSPSLPNLPSRFRVIVCRLSSLEMGVGYASENLPKARG